MVSNCQPELGRAGAFGIDQIVQAEAEQADSARHGMKGGKQRLAGRFERRPVDRPGEAARPGDQGEVGELDLEGHRPAGDLGALDPLPGIAGDALQLRRKVGRGGQVAVERPLGADRLVRTVRGDLALVDAAANAPVPAPAASEPRFELGERALAQVGAGVDAERFELAGGDRADAVEPADRKRGDERLRALGRDDAQAVGLVLVRRELGDELAVGDSGRGGEPGLGADPRPDRLGGGAGAARPARSAVTSR